MEQIARHRADDVLLLDRRDLELALGRDVVDLSLRNVVGAERVQRHAGRGRAIGTDRAQRRAGRATGQSSADAVAFGETGVFLTVLVTAKRTVDVIVPFVAEDGRQIAPEAAGRLIGRRVVVVGTRAQLIRTTRQREARHAGARQQRPHFRRKRAGGGDGDVEGSGRFSQLVRALVGAEQRITVELDPVRDVVLQRGVEVRTLIRRLKQVHRVEVVEEDFVRVPARGVRTGVAEGAVARTGDEQRTVRVEAQALAGINQIRICQATTGEVRAILVELRVGGGRRNQEGAVTGGEAPVGNAAVQIAVLSRTRDIPRRLGDAVARVVRRGKRHVAAAVGERAAHEKAVLALFAVALARDAVLTRDLHALEVVLQDEVDHARNGVSAVHGRCAAGDDLDAIHQTARQDRNVDRAVGRTRNQTTTVDQGQTARRAQLAQVEEGRTTRGRVVVGLRQAGRQLRQRVQIGFDRSGADLFQLLRADSDDRAGARRVTDADTRTGDHDLFNLSGLRVGRGLLRGGRRRSHCHQCRAADHRRRQQALPYGSSFQNFILQKAGKQAEATRDRTTPPMCADPPHDISRAV
ncbi:hypothetical protein D3C87_1078070 [compost metagenome]